MGKKNGLWWGWGSWAGKGGGNGTEKEKKRGSAACRGCLGNGESSPQHGTGGGGKWEMDAPRNGEGGGGGLNKRIREPSKGGFGRAVREGSGIGQHKARNSPPHIAS